MGKNRTSKRIKLCGVIFINEHQFLVFHCTLCEEVFDTYEALQEHLTNHFDKINVKTDNIEETDDYDKIEENVEPNEEEKLEQNAFDKANAQSNSMEDSDDYAKSVENVHAIGEEGIEEIYTEEMPSGSNEEQHPWDEIKIEVQLDNNAQESFVSVENPSSKTPDFEEGIINEKEDETMYVLEEPEIQTVRSRLTKKYSELYDNSVRKYKCRYCGFAFKDSSNLANHVRRHSGIKEYSCPFCSKEFYTSSELKAHERYHTGERPFLCTICGRRFINSGGLYIHTKRHENKRPYKCDECDKSFFEERGLQEHKASHRNERNVQCPMCPSAFKLKKTLSAHMKIHLNKREHSCHLCGASFNQRPGLISHLKSTHLIAESKALKNT